MKSLSAIFLLLIQFTSFQTNQIDFIDDLAVFFKDGDAKRIAKYFANSVELIVIDQEDVYSKAQSEQILKDFFIKYPPSKVSVTHRLNNNPNYRLAIFHVLSKNDKFRVTITMSLRRPANVYQITELRIETDKQ